MGNHTRRWTALASALLLCTAACDDDEKVEENPADAIMPPGDGPCDPSPCLSPNRGVCEVGADGQAQCLCDAGYVEDADGRCVVPGGTNDCDGVECGPNGTCVEGASGPACNCDQGYEAVGLTCEPTTVPPGEDACDPNPCTDANRTVCTDVSGDAVCECDQGYADDGLGTCELLGEGGSGGGGGASGSGGGGGVSGSSGTGGGAGTGGSAGASGAGGVTMLCTETCVFTADGDCDDGGPGSLYDVCAYGTDCTDCGPRPPLPPRTSDWCTIVRGRTYWAEDQTSLRALNSDGSEEYPFAPDSDGEVVINAQGTHVAYESGLSLWVANLGPDDPVQLSPQTGDVLYYRFTLDGSTLLAAQDTGGADPDLYLIDIDASDYHLLTDDLVLFELPVLEDDDSGGAFMADADEDGDTEFYVFELDGTVTDATPGLISGGDVMGFELCAGGGYYILLGTIDSTTDTRLWVLGQDGSNLQPLSAAGTNAGEAFACNDTYAVWQQGWDLYAAPLDGTGTPTLISGAVEYGGWEDDIWIMPDGRVVFESFSGGELWIAEPDGSSLTQLDAPPILSTMSRPVVLPAGGSSGQAIFIASEPGGIGTGQAVYSIDIDGGPPVMVTPGPTPADQFIVAMYPAPAPVHGAPPADPIFPAPLVIELAIAGDYDLIAVDSAGTLLASGGSLPGSTTMDPGAPVLSSDGGGGAIVFPTRSTADGLARIESFGPIDGGQAGQIRLVREDDDSDGFLEDFDVMAVVPSAAGSGCLQ